MNYIVLNDWSKSKRLFTPWQLGLVLALVLALSLRLVGIGFGLPLQLHPDEWSQVATARHMLAGDLNPHFFRYSSLTIYQLFVIDGALELVRTAGLTFSASAYFLAGRLLSALYGTATIGVVFWLGTLLWNRTVGLIAALLTALSPLAVQQAHYATVDTALVFWMTLALALGLVAYRKPTLSFLPAAIAAGLAIGTKYTGILILPPLLLLIVWRDIRNPDSSATNPFSRIWMGGIALVGVVVFVLFTWVPPAVLENLARRWTTDGALNIEYVNLIRSFWRLAQVLGVGLAALGLVGYFSTAVRRTLARFVTRDGLWFMLAVTGTFLITSPFVILDLPEAARDFFYEYRHMQLGIAAGYAVSDPIYHRLLPTTFFPDPWYYWNLFLNDNGWLVVAATIIGIIGLARQNLHGFAVTALLFLTGLFAVMHGAYKTERYALVLLPILYLWTASGIETIASVFKGHFKPIPQWSLSVAVAILPLLAVIAMLTNVFLLPDTRSLAWQWMQTHVPSNATVVRELNTPDLENVAPQMKVILTTSAFQDESLNAWRQKHVNYIVVGTEQNWFGQERALYPEIARRYMQLDEQGTLLAEFTSAAGQSIGPPVRIYQIP